MEPSGDGALYSTAGGAKGSTMSATVAAWEHIPEAVHRVFAGSPAER
jgi:hypothetical protein